MSAPASRRPWLAGIWLGLVAAGLSAHVLAAPPSSSGSAPSSSAAASASASGALSATSASAPASVSAPPALSASASASASASVERPSACVPHIPKGIVVPKLSDEFPLQGKSGYAIPLTVTIVHGEGERVMPGGIHVQTSGVGADTLKQEHWVVPNLKGGSPPSLKRKKLPNGKVETTLVLYFLPLPDKPGRHTLYLPDLPIPIARASGDTITLCTRGHEIQIEDPIANTPNAKPKPNPLPRQQREIWVLAKTLSMLALFGLIAAAIGALLYRLWQRRPKPEPPPAPAIPPWVIAQSSLTKLHESPLLDDGEMGEFVAQLSLIIRRYLGDRYGFDGVEATSDEVRKEMNVVVPRPAIMVELRKLLQESDTVKFANVFPPPEDCLNLFTMAKQIVSATTPQLEPEPPVRITPKEAKQ